MRVIYFFEIFKIECQFPKCKKKKKEKNYFVSDITASEDVAKNSQLRREYSSYEVDVLTNSPKILRIT